MRADDLNPPLSQVRTNRDALASGRHSVGRASWHVILFVIALFGVRLTGLFNQWFFEQDESFIATGTAALVRDNVGDLYRYTPQLGYYRLIEAIDRVIGGDAALIPFIMRALAVICGTLIPLLGFFVFREQLSETVRWLTAFVLAANPIIWKSSQYGNSALISACAAFGCLVVLSNRPKRAMEILSLGLFCIAVLLRADAILLAPTIPLLLYSKYKSLYTPLIRSVLLGLVILALYSSLFWFDPRVDSLESALSQHFGSTFTSEFWEHLLWAMSPLTLVFAVLGFRRSMDEHPWVVTVLFCWLIPPVAFYFLAATTPRYLLLDTFPLAIAAAIGLSDIATWLSARIGTRFAWSGVLLVGFIHLFVGLGHGQLGWRSHAFFAPSYPTHDGDMPTGALIYDTHIRNGFLGGGFGNFVGGNSRSSGRVFQSAVKRFQEYRTPKKIILLMDRFGPVNFHYQAQISGAKYLSRAESDPSYPFCSETWVAIGTTNVMTVLYSLNRGKEYAAIKRFDVETGDEIWVSSKKEFPDRQDLKKLPEGLAIVASKSFDPTFRIFKVERNDNGGPHAKS